jgi:sporulation protein YlmC with PRC-barrel domain
MKETIFASELSDKKVVDTGGSDIGVLDHLRVEATTGDLTDLLVIPMPNLNVGEFETSGPLIVLPFAAVNAVKDVIVVDSAKLPKVRESSAAIAEEKSTGLGMVKAKSEPEEGGRVKTPAARQQRGGAPADEGARRTVSRVKEQPARAEKSSALDEPRGHETVVRGKVPAARQQKRGAPADEGARRTVSRVKEQPVPAEESGELEAPRDQRTASEHIEHGSSEGELRTAPANDWAQRRLRRGTEPPAFEHPAFRRPASEKRQVASEPQEPPKGEQQ